MTASPANPALTERLGSAAGLGPSHAPPISDIVRVKLAAIDGAHVEITLPGTSYRLRLVCDAAESLRQHLGRSVRGRIEGRALRMHPVSAGGRFIEPAEGAPRIVQGAVQVVDTAAGRLLVDMAVPVWVTPMAAQRLDEITVGDLVNFYMESGTRFVGVDA